MNRISLRHLLLSSQLFISSDAYSSAMMKSFPLIDSALPMSSFFIQDPPTYKSKVDKLLLSLKKELSVASETEDINLTSDYSSPDLPSSSIAYHPIIGFITSSSCWYFSSRQFEKDLLAADSNPLISVHFLHINSGGGEAWYLDRLSETMRKLQKPIVALVEKACASAAYYIACHSTVINSLTANDQIGCIGTMTSYYDFSGYYEKLGIKYINVKSNFSPLKNKKYEDLSNGKPEQYIKEDLDPLTLQFINEVRTSRLALRDLPDDDPVLQGETFATYPAIEKGLIDASKTFAETVIDAYDLGSQYNDSKSIQKRITNFI